MKDILINLGAFAFYTIAILLVIKFLISFKRIERMNDEEEVMYDYDIDQNQRCR